MRKLVGENTRFIYGIGGALIAEFSGSTENLLKEYVSGGGMMAVIDPSLGTRYTTSDHLGSPRVVTNSSGIVVGRHDYMAFGVELGSGISGRLAKQGYAASDGVRDKFTGYERDSETGLDYAQARYYASQQGRFTSVDPFGASASISNPQTFNRYTYVQNSPYILTDPTGMIQMGLTSANGQYARNFASSYWSNDPSGPLGSVNYARAQVQLQPQKKPNDPIAEWIVSQIGEPPPPPTPITGNELAQIRTDVEQSIATCNAYLRSLLDEAAIQTGQPYRDIMVTFDNIDFFYGDTRGFGGMALGSFESNNASAILKPFESNFISDGRSSFVRTQTAQNFLAETLHHVGTNKAYDDAAMARALNRIFVSQGRDEPRKFSSANLAEISRASGYWHPFVVNACKVKY